MMGKITSINCEAERLTHCPKHHLFGFHDLLINNHSGDKYLSLEVECINRPPLPGELFGVGYIKDGSFVKLGETTALNYPQGARMQWVSDSNYFTVNNRVGNNWGTDLYDATINQLVDRFESPTHMLTKDGRYSLGLDYSRLNRLGGYGYTGLLDKGAKDAIPSDSGITIMDLKTKESHLLVSVRQVAECGKSNLSGFSHHYLTHLCLNPSSRRIAFLHRYFLPDGGLMTRLMTIGVNGEDLRCLGQGFLSHFDWKDDDYIYIFGRVGSSVDSFRNNPIMQNPIASRTFQIAKRCIKFFIGDQKTLVNGMSFLLIKDDEMHQPTSFAKSIITSDGHPMTNPTFKNWCVCDTYPNQEGDRYLYLFHFPSETRINLGTYRRIFVNPDMARSDAFFMGTDESVIELLGPNRLAFTRSGLHCDLHPRWTSDGNSVVFDSIHEGTRQLYRINVSSILSSYNLD